MGFFDLISAVKRVIINKPVDWNNTFQLSEQVKSFRMPVDDQGNCLALPAILISPNTSNPQVMGGGTLYLADPVLTPASYARCYGSPGAGYGDATVGVVSNARGMHYDSSNATAWQPDRTGAVVSTISGASPQTIVAAAGAGLKRRCFDIIAGNSVTGVVTVADGTTFFSAHVFGGQSVYFHFGKDGVLQPTANAAITVTSSGGGTVSATLVHDAGS